MLGYSPLRADGFGVQLSRRGPWGDSGQANVPRSRGVRRLGAPLFDSPRRASHSMPHAYSLALEYDRSACWGDCTSTMLSRKGVPPSGS
jgi:hypothetical protein